jgi:hypothetical protein
MFTNTEPLKSLYAELLSTIPKDYKEEICTFAAQTGKEYYDAVPKCLFIGKATNSWITNSKDINELFDPKNEDRIINRDNEILWVEANENPNYNTNNSAFWRVIKRCAKKLQGKEDWYNYIAWSNLYKISLWEGGNPDAHLKNIQQDMCVKILNEEIKTLKPDFVIFLTSGWEAFYLESIGMDYRKNREISWGDNKTYYQTKAGICYVQSRHPQAKEEDTHVEAIVEIVNHCGNK